MRGNGGLFGSALLVSKKVFNEMGGFDERLSTSADLDLVTRIAGRYQLATVAEPLFYYRLHSDNMHRGLRLTEKDMLLLFEKAFRDGSADGRTEFRRRAYGNLYRMLAGGYWHTSQPLSALRCGLRSLSWHPAILTYLAAWPLRKWHPRDASWRPL